jgi:ankyrin repeat protein
MEAAREGNIEICELLIKNGADVNAKVEKVGNNETVFTIAAKYGHMETCKLLIKNGADVNAKVERGWDTDWTALMEAAASGHDNVCRLLIEKGANVDAKNRFGETALMIAAKSPYGHMVELCSLLVENGADVNAKDNQNKTALMHAESKYNKETAEFLKVMAPIIISLGKKDSKAFLSRFRECTSQ